MNKILLLGLLPLSMLVTSCIDSMEFGVGNGYGVPINLRLIYEGGKEVDLQLDVCESIMLRKLNNQIDSIREVAIMAPDKEVSRYRIADLRAKAENKKEMRWLYISPSSTSFISFEALKENERKRDCLVR